MKEAMLRHAWNELVVRKHGGLMDGRMDGRRDVVTNDRFGLAGANEELRHQRETGAAAG